MWNFQNSHVRETAPQRQNGDGWIIRPLLLLSSLRITHDHPVSSNTLSSPLPGECFHFQLQAVDLVSEVLLEEPVVQFSRLAASLSLAQSGCEPYELVIKNKSHGGEEDQVHNTT